MFKCNWKKDILSTPNLLTSVRILLIPVYVTIYRNAKEPADYFLAAGVLGISCLTDWIDGKIARRFGKITTLGKILDPVADKATQLALMLCLTPRYPILFLLLIPFVFKEIFQLIAATAALKNGKMLDGALFAGKFSTAILFLSLLIMVMFPNLSDPTLAIIVCVDGLFLIFSFVSYFEAYYGKNNKLRNLFSES